MSLLGGCKCTIVIARSIVGMAFGRCLEVVCFSESPLLEVSPYIVLKQVDNTTNMHVDMKVLSIDIATGYNNLL